MEPTREYLKTRLTSLWFEICFYKNQIQQLERELNRLTYDYDDVEAIETIILDKLDEYELYIYNNELEIRSILKNNYKLY